MPRYVLAFRGGSVPETPEEASALQAAWADWLAALGPALVDAGGPFGTSAAVVAPDTTVEGVRSGLSGYTVVEVATIYLACAAAGNSPIFAGDGDVDVYEVLPM